MQKTFLVTALCLMTSGCVSPKENTGMLPALSGFNPYKDMQTIPGSSRLVVSSGDYTGFVGEGHNEGELSINGQRVHRFSKSENVFTKELAPGDYQLSGCISYTVDAGTDRYKRKGKLLEVPRTESREDCTTLMLHAEANTAYGIQLIEDDREFLEEFIRTAIGAETGTPEASFSTPVVVRFDPASVAAAPVLPAAGVQTMPLLPAPLPPQPLSPPATY